MSLKQREDFDVYQIKVTLAGIKPPIWRRIQVPSNITLYKLHRILQVVMGWYDGHLHEFTIDGDSYGEPDPDDWDDIISEKRVKLNEVISGPKDKLAYEYDFGDGWEHKLVVEKVLKPEPGVRYPICTAGARSCPPEDCGGPWGYDYLLEILGNPQHPRYEERNEWVGEYFDPEAFDLDEVNRELRSIR